MSRKIIPALTAIAILGTVAFAPTSASAWGHGGFRGGSHFSHVYHGHRFGHTWSHAWRFSRFGYRSHWHYPRYSHWNYWRYRWSWNRYRSYGSSGYPAGYSQTGTGYTPAPAAASTPAAAPPAAQPNCLTKGYLADGTAVFHDLCTKEVALGAPPAGSAEPPK